MSNWVLFAEDDQLFAMLFMKHWMARFPKCEIVQASGLLESRHELKSREALPLFAILDANLEDGLGQDLCPDLRCPYLLWTAGGTDCLQAKPQGRAALELCLEEIGSSLRGDLSLE